MISNLATPWASTTGAYSLPGSVVLKMALGEAPDHVPSAIDVAHGHRKAASSLDGGPVDRIVRAHVGEARVTRVHGSAAAVKRPGSRNLGYSDLEQVTGLARTFRIDFERGAPAALLIDSLRQLHHVETSSHNYVSITPFDFASSAPADTDIGWAARDLIHAQEALAYEPGDAGVIVGVVDSGLAPHHAEFGETRVRSGYDTVQIGTADLATGVELLGDTLDLDTRPIDRHVGHGTGCAGIIGALGLQMPPGLAGEALILPIRALGAARLPDHRQPVGIGSITDLDMGMKFAIDLGAKVINMSFGTDDSQLDPLAPKPHQDIVRYACDRGCILVAASGNSGKEDVYWPAAYPEVIAVGAVGNDCTPTSFSTRAPYVAVCAPGERVLTAGIDGYQVATGTSFAAPFVTAAAALLVARAERRSYPLEADEVRNLFQTTARPFAGGAATVGCGAGVIDVLAALKALDALIDQSLADTRHTDSEDDD